MKPKHCGACGRAYKGAGRLAITANGRERVCPTCAEGALLVVCKPTQHDARLCSACKTAKAEVCEGCFNRGRINAIKAAKEAMSKAPDFLHD